MPLNHPRRLPSLVRGMPLLLATACSSNGVGPGAWEPLVCGRGTGATAEANIGPGGGPVSVTGHTLTLPPNAVGSATTFRITERDAEHIGVEVEPHGHAFNRNATLTLSFQRCGGNPARDRDLRIVEVRSGTTNVIRTLPSVVDSTARTVSTAGLNHLSGYVIGSN